MKNPNKGKAETRQWEATCPICGMINTANMNTKKKTCFDCKMARMRRLALVRLRNKRLKKDENNKEIQ